LLIISLSLHFFRLGHTSKCLSDTILSSMEQHCKQLTNVEFSYGSQITNISLLRITAGRHAATLERITLHKASKLTPEAFWNLGHCSNLTHLDVSFSAFDDQCCTIISSQCPVLKLLCVDGCVAITDYGIQSICQGCKSMIELRICHLRLVTVKSANFIGENLRLLQTLRFEDATKDSKTIINFTCFLIMFVFKSIRWLDLDDCEIRGCAHVCYHQKNRKLCDKILDGGLMISFEDFNRKVYAIRSESQTIKNMNASYHCKVPLSTVKSMIVQTQTDFATFLLLSAQLSELREIYLREPFHAPLLGNDLLLSDSKFSHFICRLPASNRIEKITFNSCVKITNKSLEIIGTLCKQLIVFSVFTNDRISDLGVERLVKGCGETLERITFEHCHTITNKMLELVAFNCQRLKQFRIHQCKKITKILRVKWNANDISFRIVSNKV